MLSDTYRLPKRIYLTGSGPYDGMKAACKVFDGAHFLIFKAYISAYYNRVLFQSAKL